MKSLRLVLSLLLLCCVMGCTQNDEVITLTQLKLKFDTPTTNIPINKEVTFSLTGNNFVTYTDQMTLKVNGAPVEGNTYTFAETGEYTVQATAANVSSNTLNFTISDGLIISAKSALKNQPTLFTLYDVSTAEEITDQGQFYVNDNLITGAQFTTDQLGEYVVYATYTDAQGELQTTESKTFEVVTPTQRVLIEDYTGTWCGYCPELQSAITYVETLTDDVIPVAIHQSSSDTDPDPYEYEYIEALMDVYNPYNEFPMGRLNRTVYWQDENPQMVLNRVGGESQIGIAATTLVNGDQLNVDVRVASATGLHNTKILVMAVENNLFHSQANYLNGNSDSEWYQTGNPIQNYENDHVLRHAMTRANAPKKLEK